MSTFKINVQSFQTCSAVWQTVLQYYLPTSHSLIHYLNFSLKLDAGSVQILFLQEFSKVLIKI